MTLGHHGRRLAAPAILATALALAACSSAPPPTAEMRGARDAIARAQDDGAAQLAPQPLQMAQDKLARAQADVTNDKNDAAKRWAEQAQADADFAAASSNAQKAEHTASELTDAQNGLQR